MKKSVMLAVLALFLVLINLNTVVADGGYMPAPGYWVRPGQQRAIIYHEDNQETMILSSSFQGNAKDLVWIIPTPSRPEVEKANEEVFEEIAKLAMPVRDYRYNIGVLETVGKAESLGVLVFESKQVDYYDVKLIVATNSADLVTWFNENGYDYPEEYGYVLEHYINKGWIFTAIQVSPEAQGATDVIQDFREGHSTPIKMTFLSDKVVFPLKISSIDFKPTEDIKVNYRYSNYIPVQIFIIADEKYEANRFNIQYGNWVSKNDIEGLSKDSNGDPMIQVKQDKYFLTSLSASYQKSQMDDDVFFTKADDNKKVNAGLETWETFLRGLLYGVILLLIWIFTPLGIIFIVGSIILFVSSSRGARITGKVFTWVSFSLTALLLIVLLITTAINNALGNYIVVSFLITAIILLGLMILVMRLARHKS